MAAITVDAVVDIVANTLVLVARGGLGMATAAGARKDRVVRGVGVAGGARYPVIARCDRKPRVVKCRSEPLRGGVACGAGRREAGRAVVRIRGAVVHGGVTGIAVLRRTPVNAIHVATGARNGGGLPRQRKCREAVVKRRSRPLRRGMA